MTPPCPPADDDTPQEIRALQHNSLNNVSASRFIFCNIFRGLAYSFEGSFFCTGESRCYVGGRVDTSGHFCIVSNHKGFHDVVSRSNLGRFLVCPEVCFAKNAFVVLSEMVQFVGISCFNGHMRIRTRTSRNTTLHHPSMNSDTDTDPKHDKSRQFRAHLDQSRNCLFCILLVSGRALWIFRRLRLSSSC